MAALTLTGCSGDGGEANFEASVNAFCMNVAPCFDYTAQSCIDYYNAVNEYNNSANCEALLIGYFDCGTTKTCNQIIQGACDDEYNAAWNVCDELP
ncbi:MAG: hypothetical protein EP303_04195 [Deltaproteobacteria bacterium]|nr:MAG: hypothetical protein EP303_04195 [Deltaproteobacteria bacterium]